MKINKKYMVIVIIFLFFDIIFFNTINSTELQKSKKFNKVFNKFLSEDEVFPPPGWSIEQTEPSSTWYKSIENMNKYAICKEIGSNGLQDEKLITCTLNCTGLVGIYVKFDKYFYNNISGDSTASISFSIDNGSSWNLLDSWNTTDPLSTEQYFLILADGQEQVKIRWRFESNSDDDKSDYYWFDNVYIGNGATTLYETTFDEIIGDIIIDLLPSIYPKADFILKVINNCSQSRYNINYLVNWTTISSFPRNYPPDYIKGIINIPASPDIIRIQSGPMNTTDFIVIAKIEMTAIADCARSTSRNAFLFSLGPVKFIIISLVEN